MSAPGPHVARAGRARAHRVEWRKFGRVIWEMSRTVTSVPSLVEPEINGALLRVCPDVTCAGKRHALAAAGALPTERMHATHRIDRSVSALMRPSPRKRSAYTPVKLRAKQAVGSGSCGRHHGGAHLRLTFSDLQGDQTRSLSAVLPCASLLRRAAGLCCAVDAQGAHIACKNALTGLVERARTAFFTLFYSFAVVVGCLLIAQSVAGMLKPLRCHNSVAQCRAAARALSQLGGWSSPATATADMSLTHYGARAATGASLAQKMMPADPSILPGETYAAWHVLTDCSLGGALPELHWLLLNEMPPLITRPEVCAILARARIEPSTLLMGFAENRFPIGQWYAGFQEHSAAVRAMHKRRLICGTTTIGVRKVRRAAAASRGDCVSRGVVGTRLALTHTTSTSDGFPAGAAQVRARQVFGRCAAPHLHGDRRTLPDPARGPVPLL